MIILSKNMKKYRVFLFLIFLLQAISFDGSASTRQDMGPKRLEVTHEYDKSYLQIKAHPFEIAGICFTAFLFIFFLTKKRKHKKELDRVHTELTIALDAVYMAVWRYDVKKEVFTAVHRVGIPTTGMTKAELGSKIHPEDMQKYENYLHALTSGEEEIKNEVFHLNLDNGNVWTDVYATGLKDKSGKVSHIIGTERNVSAEMKQKNIYDKNKQMLEFVLKAVHITPWEYDVESQTVNISDNFLQQSNLSQNSVALDEILKYMYPSDAQLLIQGLSNLIEETCSLMVIQIQSKEPGMEDYQWFEMQAVAYQRYEDGRVRSIIGLKHDITDLKHTEELVRLREKAEESNRLKSTFLANMSHDIRTPLNAIVGFSTLMAETDDKEERQEFAQIIEANNDMLLHLINDILDMSKIEAGQMEFIYSEVNLNDLIQNLGYTFRFKIKKEVYMSLDIPSEPYILYTEKNRLTQVLSNFISNACKYTFEGSITVGYEIEGKQIYFYVRDTGKGIEKENLPHVFERFAKFDTFVKGTGLGLSICELIIQTLGGEIGVESEVGKGSTFWFTLPISERVES